MTRHDSTDKPSTPGTTDRWYLPLAIAAGVVVALLLAAVVALEIAAARVVSAAPAAAGPALAEMDAARTRHSRAAARRR